MGRIKQFIPLKKLFPVIITLITLSLIGTIYIQYNWLRIMLADRQEEFSWKVVSGLLMPANNWYNKEVPCLH